MPAVFIVMIVFLVPLLALGLLGGLIIAGIRVLKGEPPLGGKEQRDEETRLIQEIHQGLVKMENRVAALETILLDPERKEKDEQQV
ncbi:MAG: phage-shock protein [Deltaproteobacteria bacterium]|nr:phage-shock protein [Deltaproteobacteria bacterium]MBW2085444.1 phage-shock protein [Deltaproteobacteria bacterium]